MKRVSQPPSPLLMLRLLMLLLLASFPASMSGQTYYTSLVGSEIYGPSQTISAGSSCHCKVICASRTDCIAATYAAIPMAPQCLISVGPEAMVATVKVSYSTTWFKFVYQPSAIRMSTTKTSDGTPANLAKICKVDSSTPADLLTRKDRVAAAQIATGYGNPGYAWLAASDTNGDGAFEWSDGSPMVGTVFQAADIVGSGPSVMLRSDGKLERCSTNTWGGYNVFCA